METKDVILLVLGGLLALIVNMFTPSAMSLLTGGKAAVSERNKKRAIRAYRNVSKLHSDMAHAQLYFTQMWGLINGLLVTAAVLTIMLAIKDEAVKNENWWVWLAFQIYTALAPLVSLSMMGRLVRLRRRLRDFESYRTEVIQRFGPTVDDELVEY